MIVIIRRVPYFSVNIEEEVGKRGSNIDHGVRKKGTDKMSWQTVIKNTYS